MFTKIDDDTPSSSTKKSECVIMCICGLFTLTVRAISDHLKLDILNQFLRARALDSSCNKHPQRECAKKLIQSSKQGQTLFLPTVALKAEICAYSLTG